MSWTNIPNALVAVGAKPFASTLQALRDNISALANGLAGAPRVQDAALSTTVTTTGQQWVFQRLTTDSVNVRIAASTIGAVGTLALAIRGGTGVTNFGDTVAGSLLNPSSADGTATGAALTGTWRCLGAANSSGGLGQRVTLWLRIA